MRLPRFLAPAALAGLVAMACSIPDEPVPPVLDVPEGCQPLGPELSCTVPYPSDFFLEASATSRTGQVVALRGAAKPLSKEGKDVDIVSAIRADGFSLQPTIVGALQDAIGEGLPNLLDDPERSRLLDSPTLLLEADTLVPIAHFADVDPKAADGHVALTMRPFAPLKPRTRYLVAMLGVKSDRGLAEPPQGFRLLRDGSSGRVAKVAAVAAHWESKVFAPLARAGIDRTKLQLAWDFTTGSEDSPRRDLLHMRDLVDEWLTLNRPVVTITYVGPDTKKYWRAIKGTIRVPLFLDKPGIGGRLVRDAGGAVVQNGDTEVPFVAYVPDSVRDQFGPGRSIAYGHGFFGSTEEVHDDLANTVMNHVHSVPVSIDWWGFANNDLEDLVASLAAEPSKALGFIDRVHQAMANWLVVTHVMKSGELSNLEAFRRPASGPGTQTDGQGQSNAGAPLVDWTHVYFYGPSLGHILGATLFAIDRDFDRGVFDSGGAAFSHMMSRARPFGPFQFVLGTILREPIAVQAVVGMLATGMDPVDPAAYATMVDRPTLLRTGLGDADVPNLGSFFHARALHIGMTQPSAATPWGIPAYDGAATSAMTVWDWGIDVSPWRDPKALSPNASHDGQRALPLAMDQMDAFLSPNGKVVHPCPGPCKAK